MNNAVRKSLARTFEEVSIPASESASVVDIGRKLIPIEALDEIGQAAFAGMKSLNRFSLRSNVMILGQLYSLGRKLISKDL